IIRDVVLDRCWRVASAFDGRDLAKSAVSEVAHIELRPRNIGSRIKRVEDPRLLIGQGMFTDDRTVPGTLHVAFLRSIHAHALISYIDAGRAAGVPGGVGISTAQEFGGFGWADACHLSNEELPRDIDVPPCAQQGSLRR